MAQNRKPALLRQRRGTPELGVIEGGGSSVAPEADPGWLDETVADWETLWSSELAGWVRETDVPGVRRLFGWRDRQERASRRADALRVEADREPMVEGSQGQPVVNPAYKLADRADADALAMEGRIVALEDRLGLSPRARLNLGVSEQRGLNLAAMNAQIAQKLAEVTLHDPRAAAEIDAGAVEGDSAVDA